MEFLFQGPKRKDAHRLDGMLLAEEARVSTSSPCAEPRKVQTRSFWSFQPPKSSECARLNFPQGRTLPRAWKSSNALILEFSAPEKLRMCAFELSPRPNPSPSLAHLNFSQGRTLPRAWKSSNTLILEFSAPEKLKMRAVELSPRPNPSPSLEKFKRTLFGVFSPRKAQNVRF